MVRPKIENRGWAAFDRKQRGTEASRPEHDVDPFPVISNTTSSGHMESMMTNNFTTIKSFSSVIRPSLDFQQLVASGKNRVVNERSGMSDLNCQVTAEINRNPGLKLLKDIHSWADENLIEDILAAVNYDIDQASSLLKAMVLSSGSGNGSSSTPSSYEDSDGKDKPLEEESAVENSEESNGTHEIMIKTRLISVPNEPEWEEDDIYLSHRKDAKKMMRAASQHSRAANHAFLKGDHVSAHQLSLRSRSEWMAAENLNNKAAEEILRIRNFNSDIWKIDLHGLHATEAVNALKNHLHMIESKIMMNRGVLSDGSTKLEAGIPSPFTESIKTSDISFTKNLVPQPRQTVLQVITGTGNHSKGQAALPVVIRSFLIDNGYHFDDARPGVFAVRPKFRHTWNLETF